MLQKIIPINFNLGEMNIFREKYKFPKLIQEKIKNSNSSITTKNNNNNNSKVMLIMVYMSSLNCPTKKTPVTDGFTNKFYQIFFKKRIMPKLHNLFQILEKGKISPVYEVNITLTPKLWKLVGIIQ